MEINCQYKCRLSDIKWKCVRLGTLTSPRNLIFLWKILLTILLASMSEVGLGVSVWFFLSFFLASVSPFLCVLVWVWKKIYLYLNWFFPHFHQTIFFGQRYFHICCSFIWWMELGSFFFGKYVKPGGDRQLCALSI